MGCVFRRGAGYERRPVITGHPPRKWRRKIVTAQVSAQVRSGLQVRWGLHVKCWVIYATKTGLTHNTIELYATGYHVWKENVSSIFCDNNINFLNQNLLFFLCIRMKFVSHTCGRYYSATFLWRVFAHAQLISRRESDNNGPDHMADHGLKYATCLGI